MDTTLWSPENDRGNDDRERRVDGVDAKAQRYDRDLPNSLSETSELRHHPQRAFVHAVECDQDFWQLEYCFY